MVSWLSSEIPLSLILNYAKNQKPYHEMRKNAKKAAAQPIQVQAAPAQPDALEQLQKLAQLKDAGIISEEEFAAKKADLLSKI